MRQLLLSLTLLSAALTHLTASAQEDSATPSRDALLKAAVGRDRGGITAMETYGVEGRGVVIGYSSGAVLHCYGESTCEEFGGTPNVPVQLLAVSRAGDAAVIWVSYPSGALYQCVKPMCNRFVWQSPQAN